MTLDIAAVLPEDFQPYCGQVFTVETDSGAVALTLDNVKLWSKATRRDNKLVVEGRELPQRRAFALTFEGPREPMLPTQVYRLSHDTLGTFEIFLSQFRQDHDCSLYESVFS